LSADGNFVYVVGNIDASGLTHGSQDFLIIKFNASTGAKEWSIHAGDEIHDYAVATRGLPNGDLLIAGYTNSNHWSYSYFDIVLFDVDSNGRNQCQYARIAYLDATIVATSIPTSQITFKTVASTFISSASISTKTSNFTATTIAD
jgi:hypothetical protein